MQYASFTVYIALFFFSNPFVLSTNYWKKTLNLSKSSKLGFSYSNHALFHLNFHSHSSPFQAPTSSIMRSFWVEFAKILGYLTFNTVSPNHQSSHKAILFPLPTFHLRLSLNQLLSSQFSQIFVTSLHHLDSFPTAVLL